MKRPFIPISAILSLLALFAGASAQQESPTLRRALLKGIRTLRVSGEHAHPVGLDWDVMQNHVEERLKQDGILIEGPVAGATGVAADQSVPSLNLGVNILQAGSKCAYWIDFELGDQQPFKGDTTLKVTTVLWREHLGQVCDLANLQQSVQTDVDAIESRFLDDWSTVNTKEGTLTGIWDADSGAPNLKTTWELRPDGTARITSVGPPSPGRAVITAAVEESYRVDGKTVYFDVKSVSFACEDPTVQKQLDQLKETNDKDIKAGKAKQTASVEWRDKDTVVLTLSSGSGKPNQTITLRRKSS